MSALTAEQRERLRSTAPEQGQQEGMSEHDERRAAAAAIRALAEKERP